MNLKYPSPPPPPIVVPIERFAEICDLFGFCEIFKLTLLPNESAGFPLCRLNSLISFSKFSHQKIIGALFCSIELVQGMFTLENDW